MDTTSTLPIRVSRATLGRHKGNRRFYAAGRYLQRAGFVPGVFLAVAAHGKTLELSPSPVATHNRVSVKAGDIPVIDVNSSLMTAVFGTDGAVVVRVEAGRIVLAPAITESRVAARLRDGSAGSVYAGGGLFDAAARTAGFTPRFAIEIEERYAAIYERNHAEASMHCLSVHEAAFCPLPPVELLCMGIPCEPFSRAARTAKGAGGGKRDATLPATAHPLGDMTLWAFLVIARTNPRTIIIEEAPAYAGSETAHALLGALRRSGYHVSVRVISPHEHGFLARRARTVIVAQTPAEDGTVTDPWPPIAETAQTVTDVLDTDVREDAWFDEGTKPWLFAHREKQAMRGNGFGAIVVDLAARVAPVLKKRYFAGQGDNPVVPHPTRPDTLRWFTLAEARRIMAVPDAYELGEATTTAGEVLGQGVHVGLLGQIVRRSTGREDAAARIVAHADVQGDRSAEGAGLPLFHGWTDATQEG